LPPVFNLNELCNLTHLSLTHCSDLASHPTSTVSTGYHGLTALRYLDLRHTGIDRVDLEGISILRNLTHLDLGYCCLDSENDLMEHLVLCRLPLRYLGLENCYRLQDAGLANAGQLTTLCELDISFCFQVTRAGVMHAFRDARQQTLRLYCYGCYQIADVPGPRCGPRMVWSSDPPDPWLLFPKGIILEGDHHSFTVIENV
jgi:F-box/leucine-rich repeat protein 14